MLLVQVMERGITWNGRYKKIWITELGKIWTGVTIKNEKMLSAAERFIKSLGGGPLSLSVLLI